MCLIFYNLMKREVFKKHLRYTLKCDGCLKKSTWAVAWVVSWMSDFFQRLPFLLDLVKNHVSLDMSIWQKLSQQWTMRLSLQGKQLTVLFPRVRFKICGENQNFRKIVSTSVSLAVFQCSKTFLMISNVNR